MGLFTRSTLDSKINGAANIGQRAVRGASDAVDSASDQLRSLLDDLESSIVLYSERQGLRHRQAASRLQSKIKQVGAFANERRQQPYRGPAERRVAMWGCIDDCFTC